MKDTKHGDREATETKTGGQVEDAEPERRRRERATQGETYNTVQALHSSVFYPIWQVSIQLWQVLFSNTVPSLEASLPLYFV